jgi:hypothetical protein
MVLGMRAPIYISAVTDAETHALQPGLRSADAVVLRRCQILLARARGQHAREIATSLGCHDQTVRHVIHACNAHGLAALPRGSSAPHHTPHAVFNPDRREPLRALLHQSPRTFGKPTSVWTLGLAADVAYAEGSTPRRVSRDTLRHAWAALKTRWKRAEHWITIPDPAYTRKKNSAIASSG